MLGMIGTGLFGLSAITDIPGRCLRPPGMSAFRIGVQRPEGLELRREVDIGANVLWVVSSH
jgi:hypothetical protein